VLWSKHADGEEEWRKKYGKMQKGLIEFCISAGCNTIAAT